MLKRALCFFLFTICGLPNDIISFFGPRLETFADPWPMCMTRDVSRCHVGACYRGVAPTEYHQQGRAVERSKGLPPTRHGQGQPARSNSRTRHEGELPLNSQSAV